MFLGTVKFVIVSILSGNGWLPFCKIWFLGSVGVA